MKEVSEKSVRERIIALEEADKLFGLGLSGEFELACLRKLLPTMTTNSPNPVDGGVQALIDAAQEDINFLERVRKKRGYLFGLEEKKLALIKIALAALTAVPETPACFVTYWPDTEDESYREHSESNERCARRIASEIGGYVRQCFIVDDGLKVYTTPPAQLLRPVELPPDYTSAYSSPGSDERFIRKSELISVLRQQGYEVKA